MSSLDKSFERALAAAAGADAEQGPKLVPGVEYFIPTRADVEALSVGDLALDAFGKRAEVVKIVARKPDVKGKLFVIFETTFGPHSTITADMKEDELVRTVALTKHHTSAQLAQIEKMLLRRRRP